MPFIGRISAEHVLAGFGTSVTEVELLSPPPHSVFKEIFLPSSAPKFDQMAVVNGSSMVRAEIMPGDILLWRTVQNRTSYSPEKDHIVLVESKSAEGVADNAHSDWKCLRRVVSIDNSGRAVVMSFNSSTNEDVQHSVPRDQIVGHVVAKLPANALTN